MHSSVTEKQYSPNRFQHCSTISKGPPGAGTFLAYYTGYMEMHESQHVQIHWWSEEGTEAEPVELEDYTGNPILVESPTDTRIIYSKFETLVPDRIEWWQHCSLWSRSISVTWKKGKPTIKVGEAHQIIVEEEGDEDKPPLGLGYLPRCNPINIKGGMLLPLYREHAPHFHGVVLHSVDGLSWTYRGSIGKGTRCIQPTIWKDPDSDRIHSLSRRFSRGNEPYAYYSYSDDDGRTWSELENSPYFNANNSILAVGKTPLIVWNNDPTGRGKISLGTFDLEKFVTLAQLDNYGSYPAACVDKDSLYIAYTTKPNPLKAPGAKTVVKLKRYDLKAVLDLVSKHNACRTTNSFSSLPPAQSFPWRVAPPTNSQPPGNQ